MSLKSHIIRDVHGNITVFMQGDMDYEHSIPIKNDLQELIDQYPEARFTLDMSAIDFVGSSGIGMFMETVYELHNDTNKKVYLSNVKEEFLRIFKLYPHIDIATLIHEFDSNESDEGGLDN